MPLLASPKSRGSRSRSCRRLLAARNMSLRCGLVELAAAGRALNVVRVLRGRRWRKIGQLSARGQVHLNQPGLPHGVEKLLVLGSPRRLLHWDSFVVKSPLDEGLGFRALGTHLGGVEHLHLLGRRLFADGAVLLDAVLVEATAAHVAPLLVRT